MEDIFQQFSHSILDNNSSNPGTFDKALNSHTKWGERERERGVWNSPADL